MNRGTPTALRPTVLPLDLDSQPEIALAMTNLWITEVPSKIV